MKLKGLLIASTLATIFLPSVVNAHPGRTDANGGHTCRTNCEKWGLKYGEYHYHNGGSSSSGSSSSSSSNSSSNAASANKQVTESPQEVVPDHSVKVNLPSFKIYVNEQQVSNSTSKYPVFEYKDITYFPMTWNYAHALALETNWDASVGFSIKKTDGSANKLEADEGIPSSNLYAKYPEFNIFLNDSWIDNSAEDYPVLVLNDIVYFPMTWKFSVEQLGLTIRTEENALYISK